MNGLIEWFARNRVAANLLMVFIILMGVNGIVNRLPVEVFPDFAPDEVEIRVTYRGATPEQMEESIIIPLENIIADLPGIEEIQSSASEGSARIEVEVASGHDPRELRDEVKSRVALTSALPTLAATVPAGLPAQLLERRPDVLAAQNKYLASHRRVNAARKDRLPQIKLTASAGTSSDELKDVLDINNNIWSLAANLTRPILDGGKIKSQIERAEAQREEARYLYVQTALQAFAEVETTLAAEQFLVRQETALRAAVTEAGGAQALALEDYQAGLADIVTVLESQRRMFDAKRSLLELQNLRLQNRIDLYLALGGEFAEPEPNEE